MCVSECASVCVHLLAVQYFTFAKCVCVRGWVEGVGAVCSFVKCHDLMMQLLFVSPAALSSFSWARRFMGSLQQLFIRIYLNVREADRHKQRERETMYGVPFMAYFQFT